MNTARLAFRNLLRSPRRTLLTAVAIVAGVGVFILGQGFVAGLTENIIASAVDGTVGHVLARPAGYPTQFGQHPVDELLTVTPEARAVLDEQAVAWTERTLYAPIAASGADSLRLMAIGYDPQRDPRVFSRRTWKVQGSLPAPEGTQVAVSHRVARLLELKVGDPLVLQVRTHQGAMNALEVAVSAVVSTGNAALDRLGVFVPQALTRQLIASDLPSHLAVKLRNRDQADAFARTLAAALGDQAAVVTWREETAELLRVQEIRRRALDLVMLILMALAAFGIANTILMAAHERVREIGTLRAMGMSEGGVLWLFVLEGVIIGIAGSLLGALMGGGLVAYWSRNPIDFSEMFERGVGGGLSASALVYTRLDLSVVIATMALGVAVSVLASLYPARVASRMLPAEAVRAA
jgi:putative ABC transport system permease protein